MTNLEQLLAADRPDSAFMAPLWELMEGQEVLVIGNGSLGSALRFCLHRMGIASVGVDPDTWSERNQANSFARKEGEPKAEFHTTVEAFIEANAPCPVQYPVIVTATDNISSRANSYAFFRPLGGFVDIRTGKELGTVVSSILPEFMHAQLPSESAVEAELACAERGTMAHTMAIASMGAARVCFMLEQLLQKSVPQSSSQQFGFRASAISACGEALEVRHWGGEGQSGAPVREFLSAGVEAADFWIDTERQREIEGAYSILEFSRNDEGRGYHTISAGGKKYRITTEMVNACLNSTMPSAENRVRPGKWEPLSAWLHSRDVTDHELLLLTISCANDGKWKFNAEGNIEKFAFQLEHRAAKAAQLSMTLKEDIRKQNAEREAEERAATRGYAHRPIPKDTPPDFADPLLQAFKSMAPKTYERLFDRLVTKCPWLTYESPEDQLLADAITIGVPKGMGDKGF